MTLSKRSAKSDGREMQNYYEEFYSKYVKSLEETTGANMDRYVLDASFPNPKFEKNCSTYSKS